ncbi:MAG: Ribosomal large subunit pseudouridine synthase D [Acidimicrobiales bacterium]|nr:Ribosomal large subunit pseudouridine synthase D [Acidimicrobiales bacterium]
MDGERLDRVVALLTGCSRSEAERVIAEGHVAISGTTATTRSRRVCEGETIDVAVDPVREPLALEADWSVSVPVVYEDEDLVVVDKPAGLVVHPGAGTRQGTLAAGLLARYPELAGVGEALRPGIVHRLDKGTSGLLVVARNEPARRDLAAQLTERRMERRYLALVWGRFEEGSGVIDAPIGRSDRDRTRMAVTASGREARTRYHVISSFAEPGPLTLLECSLETGRTHQIRVHLAQIGHPLVGDLTYGRGRRDLGLDRVFLHSARLRLVHPRSREEMVFASELPPDLRSLLASSC